MKEIVAYKTSVATFETVEQARKDIERRYNNKLLSLARSLAPMSYSSTAEFIDTHLDEFVKLSDIRKEFTIERHPDVS